MSKSNSWRWTSLLVVFAMLMSTAAAAVSAQPPEVQENDAASQTAVAAPIPDDGAAQSPTQAPPPPPVLGEVSEQALRRIDPLLRDTAVAGGEEQVLVWVMTFPDIDLDSYGDIVADATDQYLGSRRVFMRVPARNLIKLASVDGVTALISTTPKAEPAPPDPEAPGGNVHGRAIEMSDLDASYARELRQMHTSARRVSSVDFDAPDAPVGTDSWFENSTQGVSAAWTIGVGGHGDPAMPVKYAVIDTGVDFCNMSLINRWAVQSSSVDPTYNGWPIAYDDRSASEFIANYPAPGRGYGGNWGWYVNASRSVAEGNFTDTLYSKVYTTPGTSQSGTYYYGYHPDTIWHLLAGAGSSPVVLVADTTTPGVYDTVYIDGDWDGTFDLPMTQSSPAGCVDWTGPSGTPDGVADDSYGLLYWISDGTHPLPGVDWLYGGSTPAPPAGQVVLLMINNVMENGGDHGTLCASSAAGAEPPGAFYDWQNMLPSWFPGGSTQIVAGPASAGPGGPPAGAQIVAIGNTYAGGSTFNEYLFTVFGYDGAFSGEDDANIVSMSFGSGGEDADAWDFQSEYLAAMNLWIEASGFPSPIYVDSSGNGGHGYGTVNTPGPVTGVSVGASTQYGPYNVWGEYEGVDSPFKANFHDVQPWSDRGPTAMSTLAPHVVANGAWGSGALPTNLATYVNGTDGAAAWDMWGGTSRSGPVAAGVLALIYDAYWQGTGMYPDWRQAREFLMNGALDICYDEKVAGSGQVNAYRSAIVARGDYGIYVDPPFYQAGSYPPGSGNRFESFATGLLLGQTDVTTFTVYNPYTDSVFVQILDEQLLEVDRYSITMTTQISDPDPSNYVYGAPDYVLDLTPLVNANPTADLMVVRVAYPFEHFADDPDGAPSYKNRWIGAVYNVFDDGDGVWWSDLNANGRVEISPTVASADHELDLDDDYIRFTYSYLRGTMQEMRVQRPFERMGDAIWLGLSHYVNDGTNTTHNIEIIFYEEQDWDQVTVEPLMLMVPPAIDPLTPGRAVFTVTFNTAVLTTLFTETWDSVSAPTLPAGWAVMDTSGSAGDWETNAGTVHPSGGGTVSAPNVAYFNSWTASAGSSTRLYRTSGIDLSGVTTGTNVYLDFWMYHDTGYSADDRLQVQVSTDGGTTWDDVGPEFYRYDGSDQWTQHSVDLTAYAGQSDVRIGFEGISGYGNDIHIDDIEVYAINVDAPGEYMGRLLIHDPGVPGHYEPYDIVIPMEKQVWFEVSGDPVVGGTPPAPTPYDNGQMYGAFSWGGRYESGDWRVFPFVVADDVPAGSVLLVDNVWEDYPTDIDTLLLDQAPPWDFGSAGGPPGLPLWFGPFTMDYLGSGSDRVGSRPNWQYHTNAGVNHEFVTANAYPGLHVMLHHGVLYGGHQTAVPFTTTIAAATIFPNPVVLPNGFSCVSQTFTMTFKSGLDLADGLVLGDAFGWFSPTVLISQTVHQDDPNDPSTASWIYPIVLADSYRLDVMTFNATGPDLDLFIVRDNDSSGTWTSGDQIVGASTTATADESVSLTGLPDGDYLIAVHGWSISPDPGRFDITILNIVGQGAMSAIGMPSSVTAGVPVSFTIHIDSTPPPGHWQGLLLLGPPTAPEAIEVPVLVTQGGATKTALQSTVMPGELVTYTIVITDTPGPPEAWHVEDVIPAGFEFVTVTGASYVSTTNGVTITWDSPISCTISWLDATTGGATGVSDDGEANARMPFDFQFYAVTAPTMTVGNNGGILFNAWDGNLSAGNTALTSTSISTPDYLIAPFWDDLDDETGDVYTATFGTAPHRQFVVEWHNRPRYNGIGDATFEVIFEEGSNELYFLYDDVVFGDSRYDFGASATVGVRSTDTDGYFTQYSYNSPSLRDNYLIHLVPNGTTSYTIAYAGPLCHEQHFGTHVITLTLRALNAGVLTNTASVHTNDHTCYIDGPVTVSGAIPTWDKDVWINGVGPQNYLNSPFIVREGDEVAIVDRVSVQSDNPVTYTLGEDYPDVFRLVGLDTTFGTVTTSTNFVAWNVTNGITNTFLVLTKTFIVERGYDWMYVMTETLDVVDDGVPETRIVEFEIPALVSKDGPVDPGSGDVVSYTIVIQAPDPMYPLFHSVLMTDVLPAGVSYAGSLTATFGNVWYDVGDNAVYWNNGLTASRAPIPAGPAAPSSAGQRTNAALTSFVETGGVTVHPHTSLRPEAVLWDQPISAVDTNAYADQDFLSAVNDGYDIFIADDFVNPDPWDIETIYVPGNTWNPGCDLSCADELNWEIYVDDGGVPDGDPWSGGAVWSVSLPPTDTQVALGPGLSGYQTNVTLTLDSPAPIPPGHWWLSFYPSMAFASCCQYGRHLADTTNEDDAVVINPGGGFGFPSTWTPITDASTWGLTQQDMAFRLEGGPGAAASDVVTITFDITVTGSGTITNTAQVVYDAIQLEADYAFTVGGANIYLPLVMRNY